jgi:hypothetical protein
MLVSHWAVNSDAMVRFITNAFDELNSNPAIGRAGALRGSAMIETAGGYEHPANWSPFVVVGEGGGGDRDHRRRRIARTRRPYASVQPVRSSAHPEAGADNTGWASADLGHKRSSRVHRPSVRLSPNSGRSVDAARTARKCQLRPSWSRRRRSKADKIRTD